MKGKVKASPTVGAVDWPGTRSSRLTPAAGDYLYNDPTMAPPQAQALRAPTAARVCAPPAAGSAGTRPTTVWRWLA